MADKNTRVSEKQGFKDYCKAKEQRKADQAEKEFQEMQNTLVIGKDEFEDRMHDIILEHMDTGENDDQERDAEIRTALRQEIMGHFFPEEE